jgi:RNA polymerase sigma-70 factor (ECF subfamily)
MPDDAERLLQEARAGDDATLGRLLERYRRYLALLARVQIARRLQGKVDASDVVQETFLDAYRGFDRFRGTTEPEFAFWLRQILAAKMADQFRRYLAAQGRDVRLEQQITAGLDQSSAQLERGLVAPGSSPSQLVMRAEQRLLVAEAVSQLPEDYRDVLVLRHLEGLSFPEVAQHLGRSVDSVKKLWMRGLARLRQILEVMP